MNMSSQKNHSKSSGRPARRLKTAAARLGLPALLAGGLFGARPLNAAAFQYHYDFSDKGGDSYSYIYTTTPESGGAYFHRTDASDTTWQFWGGGDAGTLIGVWTGYRNNFIARNLADGGVLGAGQGVSNPTFSLDSSWQWGDNTSNNATFMGLFNAAGAGYLASIGVNGSMTLYQVDSLNDLYSPANWRTLASNPAAYDNSLLPSIAGGGPDTIKGHLHQIITFSISGSMLNLGTSVDGGGGLGHTLSGGDAVYSDFTTLVIGSFQGYNEKIHIDDIKLSGSIIPEPSSGAAFAGLAAIAFTAFATRRRRS